MAVLADAILASAEGGEANDDNDRMITTTTTTTAMMGRTDLVVVVAAADVRSRSRARTDASLVGPLATSRRPREQGRNDLDVEGRGGTPPPCADVCDRT